MRLITNMRNLRVLSLYTLLFVALGLSAAEPPDKSAVLRHIESKSLPPHPRLFWQSDSKETIEKAIQHDENLKSAWEAVILTAEHALSDPPVVYRKDGRRLLGRSREALTTMANLGMAYRIKGDAKYVDRALAEIKAMAEMPDWNPSHFLDTAEMTLAMAIGYDWFYEKLTPEIKAMARKAIEEKGLGPYLKPGSKHGWEKGGNNWNQVCHAGMLAGALALMEEDKARAAEVVARAVAGLPHAMKVYNPDGNYPEGPGYWNYGTTFNVIAISILESALGTDFNLAHSPGFLKTGNFPLHTTGPTRLPFNFSDCGTGAGFFPAMTWFAARSNQPELMWFQWELMDKGLAATRAGKGRPSTDRTFPFVLFWAKPDQELREPATTAWLAEGQNPIAIFRTSWKDPNALFLAIKAGTPSASHGHMDIGSFVLDANGERWSLDLGAEDYNKLEQLGIGLWSGKQGGERWKIFRYHNRSHSTLLVNDAEQLVSSKAPILNFSPDPKNMGATVDMTQTYSGQLAKAVRRFLMGSGNRVQIEDELKAGDAQANVRWAMTTRAKLEPAGHNIAWLTQNGKKLRLDVSSPHSIEFKIWPADPPPQSYDARNPGISLVGFEVSLKPQESATIEVSLTPAAQGSSTAR
jgi:hypothetical protein